MNSITTPKSITPAITDFCTSIASYSNPVYLKVQPTDSKLVDECYDAVRLKIKKNGGTFVVGRIIWEWPDILLEAEQHVVWKDRTGHLCDVTPKHDGETTILFLPAKDKKFIDGIDTIRKPLFSHPLVKEFIKTCEQLTKAINDSPLAKAPIPLTGFRHVMNEKAILLLHYKQELGKSLIALRAQCFGHG